MHTALALSSLLLVILSGSITLRILRRVGAWLQRRDLELLVLAVPVTSLALSVASLQHFATDICFLSAPPWDFVLSAAVPLLMGLMALGSVGWGMLRLLLLQRTLTRTSARANPHLHRIADRLARDLGAARPRLLLCEVDRPLALTWGLWRPTNLLSRWMTQRLDDQELEAVLAHELAHVARWDFPVIWLATVLRDAFFYLPASRAAYQRLQQEKELACDDLAVQVTLQPLALAGALAKVWQHATTPVFPPSVLALVGENSLMEDRICRLMAATVPTSTGNPRLIASRRPGLALGAVALAGLIGGEAISAAFILAPMHCALW